MTWQWYQNKIAEFFRKVPDARVFENVEVTGKCGTKRQLDVQVYLPLKVVLSENIQVKVEIHIIVDSKYHKDPVDINTVGEINDLRDDDGKSPQGHRCQHRRI